MELAIVIIVCLIVEGLIQVLITRLYSNHNTAHGTFVMVTEGNESTVGIKFTSVIDTKTKTIILHREKN